MMAAESTQVQPAFLAWASAGFGAELVHLTPHTDPGASPGKKPTEPGWETLVVTQDLVTRWARAPGNVGLRTKYFPAVDVDVDDPAIAAAVEQLAVAVLGPTARRTRANSARRALLFRLAGAPFRKKLLKFKLPNGTFARVEILADGQQIAVAGVHVSGAANEWPNGQPVPDALAPLAAAQGDELLALLRVRLAALGCTIEGEKNGATAPQRPAPRLHQDSWQHDEPFIEAALRALEPRVDDYDTWIKAGQAIHAKYPGSDGAGFSAWDSWSARGAKYKGRDDTSAKWHGFHADRGVKLGSLFALAGISVRDIAREQRQARALAPVAAPEPQDEATPDPPEPGSDLDVKPEPEEHADRSRLLGMLERPCSVGRLRERQRLRFLPLGGLPEDHGWGDFMDKLTGGGIAPGSIVGVGAAGTGAGKTAFVMQLLDGLALRSALAAEDPEATAPLTPVLVVSEMDREDLECRSLGRLLDVPGHIFAAGESAKRFHKWGWVAEQFDRAAETMKVGGSFARLVKWQHVARPRIAGPALVEELERYADGWLARIRATYPDREVVPVIAVDPINRFLPLDGRSEVETLGEIAVLLDELADRRRWIVIVTADTNKTAAKDPTEASLAAAVFRGTMQLLHAFDLTIVLSAEPADPDGVAPYMVRIDKNRHGRSGVELRFRWFTQTGLRFAPESEEDWKKRVGERERPGSDPRLLERLVKYLAAATSRGTVVTRTRLRYRAKEFGLSRDGLEILVDEAVERGFIAEQRRQGRGGGDMLVPTERGISELAGELAGEVAGGASASSGEFGGFAPSTETDSGKKSPEKSPELGKPS